MSVVLWNLKAKRDDKMINKNLQQNIISIYGELGKQWLDQLFFMQRVLKKQWHLSDISPVENMSYNYVAKAIKNKAEPVVIKIHCDNKTYLEEFHSLHFFHGKGAVKLIDHDDHCKTLLLEQAIPGKSLKDFYPQFADEIMKIYVKVMQELHDQHDNTYGNYRHIEAWLKSIDRAAHDALPTKLVNRAINLKNTLLNSSRKNILLHGDLHLDNIVQASNNHHSLSMNRWMSIDPKGIIGEPEFEIAAFDILTPSEMIRSNTLILFQERIYKLSEISNLNYQRILQWIFVRVVLAAAWFIEDNLDPGWTIDLAEKLSTII